MGLNEEKRQKNRSRACMIEDDDTTLCIDPSLPFLSLMGKKYTMMVLGVIGNAGNKRNFNEIIRDIPFSSTTIIARRLKELQGLGLIKRDDNSTGVTYSLTDFGKIVRHGLLPLLRALQGAPQG